MTGNTYKVNVRFKFCGDRFGNNLKKSCAIYYLDFLEPCGCTKYNVRHFANIRKKCGLHPHIKHIHTSILYTEHIT